MAQPDLVTLNDARSPVSEAYRTLRTNLEFTGLDRPLRSLLVVSPSANAEKSATLANLAVIMAEGGRTVILADGDLRRPSVHEIFGVSNQSGLSELLSQDADLDHIALCDSGVEGLQLLTAGQVIAALVQRADLVLFDAPPVIAVTDAALLASQVDGTLLIVRAGGTQRDQVQRAKELLDQVNARIVGAVLTNASLDSGISSYYE
jgi:non-specific protein-tyrosine kinase